MLTLQTHIFSGNRVKGRELEWSDLGATVSFGLHKAKQSRGMELSPTTPLVIVTSLATWWTQLDRKRQHTVRLQSKLGKKFRYFF